MKRWLQFIWVAMLALVAASVQAQTTDPRAVAARLRTGGYVIVMRHGATNRDQADTDPLNPDNVGKQRLLSERGQEQAKQVGEAFKTLGVPFGTVYTSKFNRAVETGKLIGGGAVATTLDVTEGGLVVTPIENDRRTEALKNMIATAPPVGKNTLIVTHKPNILTRLARTGSRSRKAKHRFSTSMRRASQSSSPAYKPATGSKRPPSNRVTSCRAAPGAC